MNSRLIRIAAIAVCILIGPVVALSGLIGFDSLACMEKDQAIDWALLNVVFAPMVYPIQVAAVWSTVALGLIFGVRPAASKRRLALFAIACLAATPAAFAAGAGWAWATDASVMCVMRLF